MIDESPMTFCLVVTIDEVETGVRESIVNTLRMQRGDLTLAALMSGPVDPVTGGRPIPGMKLDPYDPAFDQDATYSASDDPRLDELLQTHPLSVTRSTLRRARATWECDSRAGGRESGSGATRPPLPPSSGPRLVLSDDFFEELLKMVGTAARRHCRPPGILFLPQGNHRIDARGAARGNQTCQCRDRHENHGDGHDRRDVVGPKAVEQSGHQARCHRRQHDTDGQSGERHTQPRLAKENMIAPEVAPNAMRTPISLVRCVTA